MSDRAIEFMTERHRNKFQKLQDENARLHTIINTYHRDIEELRKKNIYLQSWLQIRSRNNE
jgi:predicted RNase H-like nuclease (RuvC/YqgF family)